MEFKLDICYHASFNHNNAAMRKELLARTYTAAASLVKKQTGIYLTAVMTESTALFDPEKGCPIVGQPCVRYIGILKHNIHELKWREALELLIKELKISFMTSIVYLSFTNTEFIYLEDE